MHFYKIMKEELLKLIDSVDWLDLKDKALAEAAVCKLSDGVGLSSLLPQELRVLKEADIYGTFVKVYNELKK